MMLKINNDVLSKLTKHLGSYGFLKCFGESDVLKHFAFGPAGELLRETVKREWIYSNVIHRENNVFTFTSNKVEELLPNIRDAFLSAKNLINCQLPFGLATTEECSSDITSGIMVPQLYTVLKHYTFISQAEAEQFFYRFQQERKRWWRKFSLDPGKFSFAEVEKTDDVTGSFAKIVVEFPWGTHTLETIQYIGSTNFQNLSFEDENIFSVRHKNKRCFPDMIMSEVNLDYAAFSYMCDAYSTKKGRIILKFHRKLAPFKFAFAAHPGDEEDNKNLFDAAELMCLGLRKAGLSSLLPVRGEFAKKKLDFQLLKSDYLGIPYTVVLNKDTLNTGIFGLYSRDTTLQEQVHISKMPQYGELLMKNY